MFTIREPSIEAIRNAPVKLRFGSNRKLILMDAFTGSAVTQVYDLANANNQTKIDRMIKTPERLTRIVGFALRVARRQRGNSKSA